MARLTTLDNGTEVIALSPQEAANVIGLLAAQLGDVGGGAAPMFSVRDGQGRVKRVAFLVGRPEDA